MGLQDKCEDEERHTHGNEGGGESPIVLGDTEIRDTKNGLIPKSEKTGVRCVTLYRTYRSESER